MTISVHAFFESQAVQTPDAIAVEFDGRTATYGELNERANRLARHLRSLGVVRGSRVAVCVERSIDFVVGLLGVLKCDAAYVPLDADSPLQRLDTMLADVEPAAILTRTGLASALPQTGVPTVDLDRDRDAIAAWEGGDLAHEATGDDLAYVMYTSGSTGRPKGVCVPHAAIGRLVLEADYVQLGPSDRVVQASNASFDAATFEIWGALLNGARLVGIDKELALAPRRLAAAIRERELTVLFVTTALFNRLVDEVPEIFAPLRCLLFGGEAVDPGRVRAVLAGEPPARLLHVYGPTENTTFSTWYEVTEVPVGAATVPIGGPIAGTTCHVLDDDARPVPVGGEGELCLGGVGLATGYFRDSELTAAKFVPDPFDGRTGARLYRTGDVVRRVAESCVEFVGRVDHQVKLRGFRIEPGEVEAALRQDPAVRDAVVLCREDAPGAKRLVAYVVTEAGAERSPDELRAFLGERVPEYMVPAAIVPLDELPLNPNGKVDRKRLPDPDLLLREHYVAPRDELERQLALVWQRTLSAERIGIHDSFFELGGDSVLGATIVSALEARLGETMYVSAIFEAPTIAELATYLRENYPAAESRLCGDGSSGARESAAPHPANETRIGAAEIAHVRSLIEPLTPRPATPQPPAGENPRAVFVLSPPRSGSTLLRTMLAGHPALFVPPELELLSFNTLRERRAKCVGRYAYVLEGAVRTLFELNGGDAEAARRTMGELEEQDLTVQGFYRLLQERVGERLLVEKSTIYGDDLATLERIEEDFDEPLLIHLVRHPCGTIRSFQEARTDRVLRFETPYAPAQLGELLWNVHHENILGFLAGLPAHRGHRVDFESLVRDPQSVMEGLCRFLGIELHPSMLDPYRERERRMTDGLHASSRVLGDYKFAQHRKVESGVADRWKQTTSTETLGDPARRLARSLGYADVPPPAETAGPVAAGYPVSTVQRRLWFLDRAGAGAAYNVVQSLRLGGILDPSALERSVDAIVRRHEALRTSFSTVDGEPRQVVAREQPTPLRVVDLKGRPDDEREAEARRVVDDEAGRPFDLARGPLLRCTLIRLDDEDHVLVLAVHHIVFDGCSLGVFFRELEAGYRAITAGVTPDLPALPLQYGAFAESQRQALTDDELQRQLAYWSERLGGLPVLDLPTDHPRPARQSFEGGAVRLRVGSGTTSALRDLARSHGVTLSMLLQGALIGLLARYTGQDDVATGLGVTLRPRAKLWDLIGFFVNTVVLRTDLSDDPTFEQLLERVKRATLGAIEHPDVGFERLVEELQPERDLSRNPLFQVVFTVQETPGDALSLPGLRVELFEREKVGSHFDLELHVGETSEGLEGRVIYNRRLFDRTTAERIRDHYLELLRGVVERPDVRVSRLMLMNAQERDRVLVDFNRPRTAPPAERTITELFEDQAARRPDAPAVFFGEERVSYAELERRANRLANHLRGLGVGQETPVALCVERGVEMIVGLLGILKAGGAYVPLDPGYPEERLAFMLADSRAPVLLTQERLAPELPGYRGRVVRLDAGWREIAREPDTRPERTAGPENLAYVTYTSGSTGKPKGVCVPQRAVTRLVIDTDYVALGPCDRIAQASNASFDAATFEIWGALLNGGCLVGVPTDVLLSAPRLARLLREQEVTVLFVTTALFNQLVLSEPTVFESLGTLLFGGEAVDPERVRSLLARGAPGRVLHVYGPTENTTFSTWHHVTEVGADALTVPIGGPIAHSTCHVLDPHLNPAPVGVPGELYTGGVGLARCYLDDPELTAGRFVQDPFSEDASVRLYRTGDRARYLPDGAIEFLGRLDEQVKLRGFRIEPGEIETALRQHDAVRDAVVLCREDAPGEKRLAAYVVADDGGGIAQGDLRRFLKTRLPDYMVPGGFLFLDAIPVTPNGKVDRRALPAPAAETLEDSYAEPRDDTETALSEMWAELLPVERVSRDASFFDLGGHSLLAMQILSRVRAALGVEVSLDSFFGNPTVAGLARNVVSARPLPPETQEVRSEEREEIEL